MDTMRKLMNHYRDLCAHLKVKLAKYKEFGEPKELKARIARCDRELMDYRALGPVEDIVKCLRRLDEVEAEACKVIRLEIEASLKNMISDADSEISDDFEEGDVNQAKGYKSACETILELLHRPTQKPKEHTRKLSIPDE